MLNTNLETILTGSDRANYWHLRTRYTELSKNLDSYSTDEVIRIHNYLNPQIDRLSRSKERDDKRKLRMAKSLQKRILARLDVQDLEEIHIPENLNHIMTGEGKEYHRIRTRISELSKYIENNDCSLEQLDFLYKESDKRVKSFRSLDRKSARSNIRMLKSFQRKVKEKMDSQLFMENFDKTYASPQELKIRKESKPFLLTDVVEAYEMPNQAPQISVVTQDKNALGSGGFRYGLVSSMVLLFGLLAFYALDKAANIVGPAYASVHRAAVMEPLNISEIRLPISHTVLGYNLVHSDVSPKSAFHPDNLRDNSAVRELEHLMNEHRLNADAIEDAVGDVLRLPPHRYTRGLDLERLVSAQGLKESDLVHILTNGEINTSVMNAVGVMQWREDGFAEYQNLLARHKKNNPIAYANIPDFTFEDVSAPTEEGRYANIFTNALYMKFLIHMYRGDTEMARLDYNMGRTVFANVIRAAADQDSEVYFPPKPAKGEMSRHTISDMITAYNGVGRLQGVAPFMVDEPEQYVNTIDDFMGRYDDAHAMVDNLDWTNVYNFFTRLSGRAMEIDDLSVRKKFIEDRWQLAMAIPHYEELGFNSNSRRGRTVLNAQDRGRELLLPFYDLAQN